MISLVTTNQARDHLRLDMNQTALLDLPDLEFKIQHASQITLNYFKVIIPEFTSPTQDSPTYDQWAGDSDLIPLDVKAFCLLVLEELWNKRGSSDADIISEAIQRLGRMRRLPTLA